MPNLGLAKKIKSEIEDAKGSLVAVSKRFSAVDIKSVYEIGVRDFGENYIAEAVDKINLLKDCDIRWHFIGRVQSGNLNKLVNKFYLIHSLYKSEHIKKINLRSDGKQKILLQLQHATDVRGFGLKEEELDSLIADSALYQNIDFAGLMFMPPVELEGEELDRAFAWAYSKFEFYRDAMKSRGHSWDSLSMGMSNDYKKALRFGSTHVRIGTAIFGERN